MLSFQACLPTIIKRNENRTVPLTYGKNSTQDTVNSATIKWKDFFADTDLTALVDTALVNNQELNIVMQEIRVAQTEVLAKKGAYLPFVDVGLGGGIEKVGRYTSQGANDEGAEMLPGKKVPAHLPDINLGISTTWEIDIWRKLRNARDAATSRYLSSIEGKNFMVTQLVAEIARSYYELMGLDNKLAILQQNIEIQQNALKIVRLQKQAAKVTELAVRKFEAEVLKNQSLQYHLQQEIVETSNKINFLVGRFPQDIGRNAQNFSSLIPDTVYSGIPTQLLENRPDIRQAEWMLGATKLDVKVAKAEFYPSLKINANLGFQAFNPAFLVQLPASLIYSLVGDMMAPIINRKAIKAEYLGANAKQIQAVYHYERTILKAYIEVANQLSNIANLEKKYDLKAQQVQALSEATAIANNLFKSAKADYMEILMTQRDVLEAKMELIETKMEQMHAWVDLYQALGGGWR